MNIQTKALLLLIASYSLTGNAQDTASEAKTEHATGTNEFVIIVNKENNVQEISGSEVRKLYLGKRRQFSEGGLAKLASLESLRTHFNKSILRKSDAQFDSIWSRLRFSGRAKPPEVFTNPAQVLEFVRSTLNAIGFVPTSTATDTVKTVFKSK